MSATSESSVPHPLTRPFRTAIQIGVVVRDIERSMAMLTEVFGIGPFRVVDCPAEGREDQQFCMGKPVRYRTRQAFADLGTVELELIESIGRRAVPLALDVTSRASIEGLAARIRSGLVVDILVNNAGCNVRKRALDLTWDDWNRVLDTAWATKNAPRRRCSSMAACRRARREPWLPLTRPPRHGSPRMHRGADIERRAVRSRRLGAIAPSLSTF
jgi:hypothetical protein